jgi:hypothetical protein
MYKTDSCVYHVDGPLLFVAFTYFGNLFRSHFVSFLCNLCFNLERIYFNEVAKQTTVDAPTRLTLCLWSVSPRMMAAQIGISLSTPHVITNSQWVTFPFTP